MIRHEPTDISMRLNFSFWIVPDRPPEETDCFVVLSYAVKNRELPTRPTRAAIELAYTWWKKFPKAKVIMSTGDVQKLGIPDSTIMARYAMSLGLPKRAIIEEDRSRNTYENLLYSMHVMRQHGLKKPTIVASDLHMRRALEIVRKLEWSDFYWLSAYAKGEPATGYKWLQTHSRPLTFLYELLAFGYSKLRNWL